jgi:5'(3')-deoxyribonucleotidase
MNTLADFIGGFYQALVRKNTRKSRSFPPYSYLSSRNSRSLSERTDRKCVKIHIYSPVFIFGLDPIEGSIEAIREMDALGHDVRICTSPLSSYNNCVVEKFAWIENHFGREFTRKMLLTKDKTLIRGDIMIDDSILRGHGSFMGFVVFDRPHNQKIVGKRLYRWKDWRNVIEKAAGHRFGK